ncbi:MAG: CxxxxCH/CxxCH domain-containing protein [Myxococcales bacterium]|nr:CxxxxCH/CxxCH domain-containing protein [Myxococcales bacterium]
MTVRLLVLLALAACAEERDRPDAGATGARVHPLGILDTASDEFHGKELARQDYDFGVCAKCHGDQLDGGTAKVSCTSCHPGGATACTTCHQDGPKTSAHLAHRTGGVACAECHRVPSVWDDEGHIRSGGKADPAPAEVTFGTRAGGAAMFDGGRCSGVACHGATLAAGGGTNTAPRWTDTGISGACTACHAAPPPSHPQGTQSPCASCHPTGASHIDGTVEYATSCNGGCHGSAASAAPPRDLAGNTSTTALGVGAHQVHLNPTSGLRGPIACTTCHAVPSSVTSPGHLDTTTPAEVVAALGWDRASATCTTSYCHGPARPVWTQQGGATCGSCHGLPPATPSHDASMPLSSCVTCHSQWNQHLDGDVDVD